MSTVHLHIGQCGNQLSFPLWQNFINVTDRGRSTFLSLDGYHRSVHIDSESKVLAALPREFKIREKNIIVGKRGRGTNFALGYYGMKSHGDDHLLEHGMEAVRKEIERCDLFSGIIVYHSISGGTGSGVGAHMIELLRDHFPCTHIMSCAVAPCTSGESPLQNYNALLSLHWLQTYTDSVILLLNDFYISHLKNLKQSNEDSGAVSFYDINKVVANNLSGLFHPTDTLATTSDVSLGQEPWELVRTLTPMPATKLVNVAQHASSKLSWEGLTSKVLRCHSKFDSEGKENSSLAATVVARGDEHHNFMQAIKLNLDKKIRKGFNFVDWNPYPLDCWTAEKNTIGSKKSSTLTMAVNSTCILDYLKNISSRSLVKLDSGAYLHWYDRYGISQEMFSESVQTLQTLISDYEDIRKD